MKKINHFKNNRKRVQNFFIDCDFLLPLTEDKLPYSLYESKNAKGDGKLRKVNIDNIPVTDSIRPTSYVLDIELNKRLFTEVQNQKKVEKVFLILCCNSLSVVMVEMKSSLKPSEINNIHEKIKDTITRLSFFLPNYILDDVEFDNYAINYNCLVIYNSDLINRELEVQPELNDDDLVKIFLQQQVSFHVKDSLLGGTYKVNVDFIRNTTGNAEEFEIDFEDVFANNTEIMNAIYTEKTLP